MALPFLNPETKQTAFNTTIEVEPLPDHIQLAKRIAGDINQYEDPSRRIEILDFIKRELTEQFVQEKQYHTQRRESATTMIQSIETCLSTL